MKKSLFDISIVKPLIIAGPCSAESREQVLQTAEAIAAGGIRIFRAGVWKPRTRPGGFEGRGQAALEWLKEVKTATGMEAATEVASPAHVEASLKAGMDYLWIGARTTANPFAVQEIADALKGVEIPVLVKNPVNPDIELWCGAVQRLTDAGVADLCLIHRGFSSYEEKIYRNSPIWQIPIEMKRRFPELQLLCDPSHIAGKKELVSRLCRQAMDLDFDGLMVEVHCSPECALSDSRQQITPKELFEILNGLKIRDCDVIPDDISLLREKIDRIDRSLLTLLSERMSISREIGVYKKSHNIPVLQSGRYDTILNEWVKSGSSLELDAGFVAGIIKAIHEESVKQQI